MVAEITPDPRIAVVVITHNRADEVLRTLDQLVRLPERPRIVIVDNGSTDGTADAIGAAFPAVKIVRSDKNLGASARNLGVAQLDAPYVAFCDDDTWWQAGSLRRAADLLDADPKLALLTARILVGPDARPDPVCDELARSPIRGTAGLPGPPLLGFLAGASVVRRSAFLEAGGFEPRFFIGGEEELLAVDLAARGGWLCYVPELVVHHHPSPRRDVPRRRWTMVRNALWFGWLRRPWPAALRKTCHVLSREPRDHITARGVLAAVCALPWVLRRRRVVPAEIERALRLLEAHAECSSTTTSSVRTCLTEHSA